MTLKPYTPDRLDQLALRVLDVCGQLHAMARRAREDGLEDLHLHDKKALEWLSRIEEWTQKSVGDFELAFARHRGARRAAEVAARR